METYRQTIYCDLGFLETILSKQDCETPCLDNSLCIDEEIAAIVRELLLSKDVNLYLNISQSQYESIDSKIHKKRLKAAKKGIKAQLTPLEELFFDIQSKQQDNVLHLHTNASGVSLDESLLQDNFLNAIFFLCESKEACEKAMQEYGVIVICLESINDFKHLFFEHGVAFHREEVSSWKDGLSDSKGKFPCNSLIVVDNYILNNEKVIDENLIQIFDLLIPQKLNDSLDFQITIFALLDDGSKSCNPKDRHAYVEGVLKQIRPDMKFSITIIKNAKDKFHDRTIVSSNFFIGCAGGFDLFKSGVSKKTTTVCAFHPFLYTHNPWSRKAYSDFLNDACYEFFRASGFNEEKAFLTGVYFGERKNRLLNQVKR